MMSTFLMHLDQILSPKQNEKHNCTSYDWVFNFKKSSGFIPPFWNTQTNTFLKCKFNSSSLTPMLDALASPGSFKSKHTWPWCVPIQEKNQENPQASIYRFSFYLFRNQHFLTLKSPLYQITTYYRSLLYPFFS